MQKDEIIRLAREANLPACHASHPVALSRFAVLVAAAERDRCCKIIYSMAGSDNVAQRTVDAIKGKQ